MKKTKITKYLAAILTLALVLSTIGTANFNTVSANEEITTAATENSKQEETTTGEVETTASTEETTASVEETTTGQEETSSGEEETTEPPFVNPTEYTLIGHRGYSGYAPLNSMPAFKMAVAAGFTTIELDIRRTKPDANGNAKWVISHDDSLKNTMGVDKNISDLTYEQIMQYSYTKGNNVSAYKNLKISTLEEVIAYIKECKENEEQIGHKINWQIEIKTLDDYSHRDYFEEEIVKPIMEADVQDWVSFSSFHYSYLSKIKEINSDFKTWFLDKVLDEDGIEYAKKCGAEGISFNGTSDTTKDEAIKLALDNGFMLGCYTINSPVVMGAWYQKGVRFFATDYTNPMDVSMGMMIGKYNVSTFTTSLSSTSYTYNGDRKKPSVTVKYKDFELVEGVNYEINYSDNKLPGTAKVTISGINNCVSDKELTYKISMPKVKNFKIVSSASGSVKLSWSANTDVTGYIVYQYNYSTKKYSAIKTISNPLTNTYTVKGLKSSTRYRFRVKTYLKEEGKTYKSSACTSKSTYTGSAKPKNVTVKRTSGKKKMKIKWNAVSKCNGYYIKVATDKAMKNVVKRVTISKANKTSTTISGLKKKNTYYVKIKSYHKIGKTKYYGTYSAAIKSKGSK